MQAKLSTYHLRRYINALVGSTEYSPSLAEMLHHHLEVAYDRQKATPFHLWYEVHDDEEQWIRLHVIDARGYPERLYLRGQALLRIGVNGALASPDDDAFAHHVFGTEVFRTCRYCGYQSPGWFDYYGHLNLEHWGESDRAQAQ